ncbi:hypothetical protein CGT92_02160 [Vibrio metoecus]|uniref:Uncharacterized protein n=1 Tax=Vibrio metoecus TaxID=1481663 RepID=A0A0Q0PZR4_VIBMT|nr:hypothetical protein AAY54_17050 [Vibrio metoecus]KQA98567.1 hypothetical protein XV92_16450 [Vibrio metoecus]KQA98756.1 hypothetical protein XV91_11020 [Vibrio metoecus]KQB06392.1 hypothetical protein XV93_08495 [Vibrio metoecus]PAR28044.1 hypothetical protein CGU00_11485 [Vibrio metoecus]
MDKLEWALLKPSMHTELCSHFKKDPPLCEFWLSFVHLSRYIDMKSKICRIFLLSKLRFYGFHERG